MRITKVQNYDEMSRQAAELVKEQVAEKRDSILGLVTGGTTEKMYDLLVDKYRHGEADFSHIRTVNTDEYYRIKADDPNSYAYFMKKHFFERAGIKPEQSLLVNGFCDDPRKECIDYERRMRQVGAIDLLVLGMGENGHVAFNEPCAAGFPVETHAVDLEKGTIQANARFFERYEDVPKQAITIGFGAIMRAKKILFLISGAKKRDALQKALYGPVTPTLPASILQLHPDVHVIADEEALV